MAPKRTETTPAQYSTVSRNSPLISWTWEGRRYTQALLLKANKAHLWRRGTYPQVLITSNPASQHTCFTSSPNSSAAATLRSGSPHQRLGWPFCFPAKSVKETRSVKSPTWARQPVQTTLRRLKNRLKTNEEDSLSHIKIHVISCN